MSIRTVSTAVAAFLAFTLFVVPFSVASDAVVRFEGTTTGNANGHKVMLLGVSSLPDGKPLTVPVPSEDPKKPTSGPKGEFKSVIDKLTKGDIIKITVEQSKDYGQALSIIAAYELKPGEDTPSGYVFSKSFESPAKIVLTKFGVEYSFGVVMRKDEKGKQVPDPDVLASVAKLSENTGVWVQTVGKNIVAIEPYAAPQTGKVDKLADAEIDGHKLKSAEIATDDGKTVTVLVPGKEVGKTFVPDSLVLGQLNKVKVGSAVEFRVHEDGDKLWLREITVSKPKKAETPKK